MSRKIFKHCRKELRKNCNVITMKHQRHHKSLMMTNWLSLYQGIDVALQSRLYDDEKYVDKIVTAFTEVANMYNTVTANCNKNAETLNRNIQLTEKRYAAMMKLMQTKKSKTIELLPIPQTMKALPRFLFLTYPRCWIKRMYRSKHIRQFLIICMACLLAVSVFLTIFLAYDNAQTRRF